MAVSASYKILRQYYNILRQYSVKYNHHTCPTVAVSAAAVTSSTSSATFDSSGSSEYAAPREQGGAERRDWTASCRVRGEGALKGRHDYDDYHLQLLLLPLTDLQGTLQRHPVDNRGVVRLLCCAARLAVRARTAAARCRLRERESIAKRA